MSDNYPQLLTINTSLTQNVTWTAVGVEIPLLNIPQAGKGKARVIEIVDIKVQPLGTIATNPIVLSVGAFNYDGVTLSNSPVVTVAQDIRQFLYAVIPLTGASYPVQTFDMTYDGRGLLFPSSTIYFNTSSASTTNQQVNITMAYRIKSVSLREYLDIVNQYQLGGTIL